MFALRRARLPESLHQLHMKEAATMKIKTETGRSDAKRLPSDAVEAEDGANDADDAAASV
jgi:hypothetical protein